jgi:hypothetical protein
LAIGEWAIGPRIDRVSGSNNARHSRKLTRRVIKDDLPSDEVAKKCKNSRMSSRHYDKKVSGKKKGDKEVEHESQGCSRQI